MFEVLCRGSLLLLLASDAVYATSRKDEGRTLGTTVSEVGTAKTTTVSSVPVSTSATYRSSNSTCISGTVNYITHTLPQQCLRTDRVSANVTERLNTTVSAAPQPTELRTAAGLHNACLHHRSHDLPQSRNNMTTAESAIESTAGIAGPTFTDASSSVTTATSGEVMPSQGNVVEQDSLFDSASFLSFEEWKKQNLAKTGQSLDNVGQEPAQFGDRQRPGINNALDTLGEESEIDLDFAGFRNAAAMTDSSIIGARQSASSSADTDVAADDQSAAPAAKLRSKDAGKTCKERTNYASFDCAATMMKNNLECKHPSSILIENKDSYMLNTCAASNKFFIVELCNDIHIDTIVLANYEFFSSIFRHFRVSVSDRYPVKAEKWKELGTFEARNTREVQAFLVEEPQVWARYLRIEFLTHYGSEYYCPVSLLRVHGKTMMQEFRQEEEMARGELSDEEPTLETIAAAPVESLGPLATADESDKATVQSVLSVETSGSTTSDTSTADRSTTAAPTPPTEASAPLLNLTDVVTQRVVPTLDQGTCAPSPATTNASALAEPDASLSVGTPVANVATVAQANTSNLTSGSTSSESLTVQSPVSTQADPSPSFDGRSFSNATASDSYSVSQFASAHAKSSVAAVSSDAAVTARNLSSSASASPSSSASSTSTNSSRSTPAASPAPQASSQESFFKSISKRLQQLESNSTLSLQYIEEQSRILRDAFNKVEKRQISATTTFLSHLNETVMTELYGFRQAYDQLWQGTVLELEGQREQYQREMLALSSRLALVADELVWQKRMGIVQSTLLLLCLGLVLFARQGTAYVDMTLAQSLMSKSQAALRAGRESEPNIPSPTSRSPVSIFRRKLWRSSTGPANGTLSEATDTRPQTRDGVPNVAVELPTPPADDEESDDGELNASEGLSRTQSNPPTPDRGFKQPPSSHSASRAGSPLRGDIEKI